MKRINLLAIISILFAASSAQTQVHVSSNKVASYVAGIDGIKNLPKEEISRQVLNKARIFCQYVTMVGSTFGASDKQKLDIIQNKVSSLFFEYEERKMVTTRGKEGKVKKTRLMNDYFNSLYIQSKQSSTKKIEYSFTYNPQITAESVEDTSRWKQEKVLSDGCILYSTTIKLYQLYHVVPIFTPNTEFRGNDYYEADEKELTIYILVNPKGKAAVFLGDVNATRIQTPKS